MKKPTVDLVVASYGEDLAWIKWVPEDWRVFISSAKESVTEFPPAYSVSTVPNEAREASQYLRHIIRNYGNFSEYTLFLQGMPFDHSSRAVVKMLTHPEFNGAIQYLGAYQPFSPEMSLKIVGPFVDILKDVYGDQDIPPAIPFSVGAQFYVHRDLIMDHPVEFYERLLKHCTVPAHHPFAYLIEGAWGSVFNWPKFV